MSDDGVIGQQGLLSPNDEFTRNDFHIDQKIGRIHTAIPVKIIKVYGGGVGPAPTVDVQPLVHQVDGEGKATEHDTVYGIQTHRSQGGNSVVINDPVVGDVGHMVIPHRDISSVRDTGDGATPGSGRRFSHSDGIYHGSMGLEKQKADSTPKHYIHFTGNGMDITTPGTVTITAATINLVGDVHLGATGGVPASMQGTKDTAGDTDVSNLATKVWVT